MHTKAMAPSRQHAEVWPEGLLRKAVKASLDISPTPWRTRDGGCARAAHVAIDRNVVGRIGEDEIGAFASQQAIEGWMASPDASGSRPADRNLKIGTVLVRDYQGRRHTVTVEPEGYVWEAQAYSSLSAIARAITGTAWSGPRFFALNSAAEPRDRGATQSSEASRLLAPVIQRQARSARPNPIDQEYPPCHRVPTGKAI